MLLLLIAWKFARLAGLRLGGIEDLLIVLLVHANNYFVATAIAVKADIEPTALRVFQHGHGAGAEGDRRDGPHPERN